MKTLEFGVGCLKKNKLFLRSCLGFTTVCFAQHLKWERHLFTQVCKYLLTHATKSWKVGIWVSFLGLFLNKQNYFQKKKEGCRIIQNSFLKLSIKEKNKGKDSLDFWSMVLKSIISSWEGTISCKIWKIKDKTQRGYFNVKAFEDFYLTKKSTGFRDFSALVHLVQKIKQSGTLVPWYKEWLSRSILHICDPMDEIPSWLLTNTACGKYNVLKEHPKSISRIPFF